jgi:hypothetical protein
MAQRGNIDYSQIQGNDRQGTGTKFQMFGSGTTSTNHLTVYDANANLVDGSVSGNGGTIAPQLQVYNNAATQYIQVDFLGASPNISTSQNDKVVFKNCYIEVNEAGSPGAGSNAGIALIDPTANQRISLMCNIPGTGLGSGSPGILPDKLGYTFYFAYQGVYVSNALDVWGVTTLHTDTEVVGVLKVDQDANWQGHGITNISSLGAGAPNFNLNLNTNIIVNDSMTMNCDLNMNGHTPTNWAAQTANKVFAGPASGSAAPTFRALVQADMPSGIAPQVNADWNASSGLAMILNKPTIPAAITFAGDLSGTATTQTVIGLQGRGVTSTAPTDGQVLTWVQANSDWEPKPAAGYTLPIASASVLGGVKVGTNISVDGSGIISLANSPTVTGTMQAANANATTQVAAPIFACVDTVPSWTKFFRLWISSNQPTMDFSGVTGSLSIIGGLLTSGGITTYPALQVSKDSSAAQKILLSFDGSNNPTISSAGGNGLNLTGTVNIPGNFNLGTGGGWLTQQNTGTSTGYMQLINSGNIAGTGRTNPGLYSQSGIFDFICNIWSSGSVTSSSKFISPQFNGQPVMQTAGPVSNATGSVTSHGGTMVFWISTSCFCNAIGVCGLNFNIDGSLKTTLTMFLNTTSNHYCIPMRMYAVALSAGSHTVSITAANAQTLTDSGDWFQVYAIELPI